AWTAIEEGEIPGVRSMTPVMMSIGYERTGDMDFVDAAMVMVDNFLQQASSQDNAAATGYTKANAMLYRGLWRILGHAHALGLLDSYEIPYLLKKRQAKA